MTISEITHIIKQKILVERLELEDVKAEDIVDEDPLFGDGLGLDSVEALDVVAGLKAEFGIELQGTAPEAMRQHFASVRALAEYVFGQLAEPVQNVA